MWLFCRKRARSVVLIDISAASVSGAYARCEDGKLPVIYFSLRQQIARRGEESDIQAMTRTLDALGLELITKGAPVLRRETGSGHVDEVLVSLGAPWQDAQVRHHTISPGKPFMFSKQILSEVLASGPRIEKERISGGDQVVATMLNGYLTPDPLGKEAKRAVISVLSSTLAADAAEAVRARVRRIYHAHDIHLTAFSTVTYAALRRAYAHEKDFLVIAADAAGTDIACSKDGRLLAMRSLQVGTHEIVSAEPSPSRISAPPGYVQPGRPEPLRTTWITRVTESLREIAETYALPRTLFLVAEADSRDRVRSALSRPEVRAAWLSEENPIVIPVLPEHLRGYVQNKGIGENDLNLSLLAIYAAARA